jgi:hypothetical protein
MFENTQIFPHLHLKFAKSAIMTPKNFFRKKWVKKFFYADFKYLDADLNKCPLKKL